MIRRRFVVGTIAVAIAGKAGAAGMKVVAKGRLRAGVHEAQGTASVLAGDGGLVLRFEKFEVTEGPDLKVWLVKAAGVREAGDVTGSEYQALGPLKAASGDQDYPIPKSVDIAAYKSVVVWCEEFSVLFAAADLAK